MTPIERRLVDALVPLWGRAAAEAVRITAALAELPAEHAPKQRAGLTHALVLLRRQIAEAEAAIAAARAATAR